MKSLPFSVFKIVQALTYPKKSEILCLNDWDTKDFDTTHSVVSSLNRSTNIVILPSGFTDLDKYLQKFHNIDYSFHLLIHSFDTESLSKYLINQDNSDIIIAKDGSTCVLINKFSQNSFLAKKIKNLEKIIIDDPYFLIPNFDKSKWHQQNTTVFFDSPDIQVTFSVPNTFSLKRTSPDLLWAIETVLLSPWHDVYQNNWVPTRRPGKTPGISFSGGVDSTAAMELMPKDSILFYMKRNFESMINHVNAKRFISKLQNSGRTVVISLSNHEKIRTFHNKNPGFSTDYACMAHLILLADHYDLDSAATGMPLENSYFFHGSKVRDFQKSGFWRRYQPLFSFLGIPLYQPVAGCSEILNNKIVNNSKYKEYATSCLRSSVGGETCNQCWKCFRKNVFNNLPWKMSPEISKFLEKRPLKQGVATLYALQLLHKRKQQLPQQINDLHSLLNENLEFLHHYWEPSIDLLPKKYQDFTKNRLETYTSSMDIELYSINPNLEKILRGESK